MTHYIDKSELISQIEKRKKEWSYGSSTEAKYKAEAYTELLEWLDIIETKEIDFEKELQSFFYPHVPWGDYCKNEQEDIKEWSFKIAKHFFELGLAQKGLELTWEDISIIRQIMFDYNRQIRNEMTIPSDEDYCKELLQRFKAHKGE